MTSRGRSEPSDEQRTELAKSGTDIVVSTVNAGLISPRTALKELKQQSERTGVWTNITDADIEKASDEIDAGGEMGGFGNTEEQEELPQQEGQDEQIAMLNSSGASAGL